MSKHVVLFTPFAPSLGGGATILRSLVPHLEGFRIEWVYTAPRDEKRSGSTWLGPPLAGGSPWRDISRTVALWSGIETNGLRAVVAALRARRAEGYWIVGHNEGALVARLLAHKGERVHLTIHDDVPDGIMGRSVRYRYLGGLARRRYASAMRSARSLDFITERMRSHYRETLGLDGVIVRPFLPSLTSLLAPSRAPGELQVGHVGTIYAIPEWRAFVRALERLSRRRGLRPRMIMVGLDKYHAVAKEFPGVVEILPDMPEAAAIERLMATDLCYAMYPFDRRADVFRRTSLPTKLSTYVQCRKPVFAHAPMGTSLGDVIETYGIGKTCHATSPDAIEQRLAATLDSSIPAETFETVREAVYGKHNVQRMASCLEELTR